MTVGNIKGIRASIEAAMAAIVPDIAPDIRFIKGATNRPLENMIFGSRFDACRRFQVFIGPAASNRGLLVSDWNGSLMTYSDSIAIKIRYEFGNADGGYEHVMDMIAADQPLIAQGISPQSNLTINDFLIEIRPSGTVVSAQIDSQESAYSAYLMTLHYDYTSQQGD